MSNPQQTWADDKVHLVIYQAIIPEDISAHEFLCFVNKCFHEKYPDVPAIDYLFTQLTDVRLKRGQQ